MEHSQPILCPHCSSKDLVKNGHQSNGEQRWRCNICRKSFLLNYRYKAREQGIEAKIIEMTLNSSGVRDVGRVLKISKDTVTAVLKKKRYKRIPTFLPKREPKILSN
jgi:transposase